MAKTDEKSQSGTLEELELRLLLLGVYEYYGIDFRDYARGTLKRRVAERLKKEELSTISELLARVLHDKECLNRFVNDLSITVSTMFRDPDFFIALRNKVIPLLHTYPFIRIWHAGCGKGEEVYSLAILLYEEGLHNRCRIYATDINQEALELAQRGIYPLKQMQNYTRNYLAGGGKGSFSDYYLAKYGNAIFRPWLKENVVFSRHNLTTDGSFNEFNVILCRNVLIYFNQSLQKRVHSLFYHSLNSFGFLALGQRESISFTPYHSNYEIVDQNQKIYKKATTSQ